MGNRDGLTPNQRRHRSGRAWQAARLIVLERDGYLCQLRRPGCTTRADTVDHIVPLSVDPGQPLTPDGLRAACSHCNTGRHDGRNDAPTKSRVWLRGA